jgi:hypothetical protein
MNAPEVVQALPGMRLSEALAISCAPELLARNDIVILNHGVEILDPENYYLHDDDRILVGVLPQGGGGDGQSKGIGQIIVGIILVVASFYTGGTALAAYGPSMLAGGAGLILGGLAGLLIKPPTVGTQARLGDADRGTASYGITGQSNAPRPYQACLKIYGQYKIFPALAANPIITSVGIESTIAAIYDFGIGNVAVSDIRVGDTTVGQFDPELRLHTNVIDIRPELCNRKVAYDQFAFVLQQNDPLTVTTNAQTWLAELTLTFSQGLVQYNNTGDPVAASVDFYGRYREAGGGAWTDILPSQILGMPCVRRDDQNGFDYTVVVGEEGYVQYTIEQDNENSTTHEQDIFTWRGDFMGLTAPGDPLQKTGNFFGYDNPLLERGAVNPDNPNLYALKVTTSVPHYDTSTGFRIVDTATRPKSASINIQFPTAGQYEIELTRITPISNDTKLFNTAALTMLKSSVVGEMFKLRAPHTMLELKLLASEKVSGVIQNLSAIAVSVLPAYDAAGNFTGNYATRNPAWCALDVLIGSATPKPVPLSLIDWPSWYALAVFCDTPRNWIIDGVPVSAPRHTCDFVVDFVAPVKEIVESILSCCRASLIFTQTGKYGVLIDQQNNLPRQLITPSNSWNFAASLSYADEVHALRVSFIDRDREYQRQEVIVYRDGYDASNATRFEELGTAAITEWFRAWAYGRFMFAQSIIRREPFTISMDIEHLAFQRGDLVLYQHDVPKIGGYSSRVVQVSGNAVTIGQDLSSAPTAYTARLHDGTLRQGAVTGAIDSNTFTLDNAAGIQADDLIVLGIVDRVTRPYLVMSITPQADMVAQISLCAYDPALYDADIGALPTWNPAWGDSLVNATNLAVTSVTLTSVLKHIDRRPLQEVTIAFTVNSVFYAYAEIWLNIPNQRPELVDRTETHQGLHSFSLISSYEMNLAQLSYTVTPFTNTGLQGTSMTASTVPMKNGPPSAPPAFDLDVKRETITLIWSEPADQDILGYEILYDPRFGGAAIGGATRLTPSIPWPARTFEVPLRLGHSFLRSIDTAGQRSPDYAVAFTPTDTLWNLNVITTWDDDPEGWPGIKSGFVVSGANSDLVSLPLADGSYPARSEYYYFQTYDGGEIYQTRFTSKIVAAAYNATSFMSAWIPLAIAQPIGGWEIDGSGNQASIGDNVDVWHEIRWIDASGAMIEWVPLAIADPIGWGRSDVGVWRHFQVGDYIGRLFQFRIVAEYRGGAQKPNVGVVIGSAIIEIDMPDRTDGQYNILSPAAGLDVIFNPAFKVRPALSITPDLAQSGERYAITAASATGFRIQFFNAAGTGIARNFDWIAKGYGARGTTTLTGMYQGGPLHAKPSINRQLARPGDGPFIVH